MEPLVSIIIPFYNEENYIERSIISAIDQSYPHTEIILVNDGSTDTSASIVNTYVEKYANVTCITTANFGLGNARNVGIERAIGQFITFLDSDDALESNAVKLMVDNMMYYKSDIVVSMFTLYSKAQKSFKTTGWKKENNHPIKGMEGVEKMYTSGIASTVWAKLYKTEIVKKIQFPTGVWFEDRPFLMEYLLQTDTISFVEESLLRIYAREDSITRRTVTKRRIIDLYKIYEVEMNTLKKYQANARLHEIVVYHHINVKLDTFFLLMIDKEDIKKKSKEFRATYLTYMSKFKKNYQSFSVSLGLKKRILIKLLNLPRVLPWSWTGFIVRSIFNSRYEGIRILKKT
ncbi:glycosyltransferase family 2 protein [Aquimarina sp. 2201CG1-2-11]|uniref:glycosyltransferase family 2 protein n=1 Tax=Aquimarina discodermiae TaxID=3231043 RepID=UPI003462406F